MRPKSKNRFALKIILSYAVLGILATLAGFFIYNEFKSYASFQKSEESNQKLLKTNRLLTQLYDAENLSKLALQTKRPKDLQSYAQKVDSINQFIDALKPLAQTDYGNQGAQLDSVQELLKQKVFNNAELRKLKVRNENSTSLDSVLKAFHDMEVDMGRITPETFAPNFEQLSPKTQKSIREYVALLNKNIPDSENGSDANNIDSILEVSKSILNKAKNETAIAERSVLQKELEIYRTDLELSQKMRGILSYFEREMAQNAYLDNVKQEQALQKSSRLAAGAVVLGLITVVVFTLLITRDFWKVQQYREQLERAKTAVESLLRTREQLISTVSHDLRTPLNTINGYSELIEQSSLDDKQLNYIKKVRSSSEYVEKLVNDLLDYSKLEAGGITLEKVPFELYRLLEETAGNFEEMQSKKGVSLQLDVEEILKRPVLSDPFRIKQILTNLIGNAFKFTDEGYVKVLAYVEERNGTRWATIQIMDTGIGIPREQQETIFQEFTQAEASTEKKQMGYGLGLTISRNLAQLLGGELNLKSEQSRGSTFTLQIPVEFSEMDIVRPKSKNTNPKTNELTILVIDDDENMLGLVSEICKVNGITAHTFTHFEKVDKSSLCRYDAVLTDMEMPQMDGWDVLESLTNHGFKNSILLMTGKHVPDKTVYLNAGFSNILQKPFSANKLLELLPQSNKVDYQQPIPSSTSSLFSIDNISPFLGDFESLQDILMVFLVNSDRNMDILFSAVGNHDYSEIRTVSHKMLPMFRQLEAKNAIVLLEVLETIPDDAEGKKVHKMLSELKDTIGELRRDIEAYLSKHPIDTD